MERLTSKEYWKNYYTGNYARDSIIKVCSEWDEIFDRIPIGNSHKTLLEIGGYPGRYASYLAKKFKLIPSIIDFNPSGSVVENVMKEMQIEKHRYINEDFFSHCTSKKYDLVFSMGFIEHFSDFNRALDLHTKYLSYNGYLLIIIPSKRYGQLIYRYIFDRDDLEKHNKKCMNLKTFVNFA